MLAQYTTDHITMGAGESSSITDEQFRLNAALLREQWAQKTLEISATCAPHATVLIDGMPSVVKHPNHFSLHKMAEFKPREAVVWLMDTHVIPRNLWRQFFMAMEKAGLSDVLEEFFSHGALRDLQESGVNTTQGVCVCVSSWLWCCLNVQF